MITRPYVTDAASKLSEHLTNPSRRHLELANRTIDYLIGTRSLAIQFNGLTDQSKPIFLASSDASFADDPDTRYSSQGYAFTLFNGPIDWKANKHKTVTLSSTEGELLAMSTTGKETIWWTRFSMRLTSILATRPLFNATTGRLCVLLPRRTLDLPQNSAMLISIDIGYDKRL